MAPNMKKYPCRLLLLLPILLLLGLSGPLVAQQPALYENLAARNNDVAQRRAAENTQRAKAQARAARIGLPVKSGGADLIAFEGDVPVYYDIKNINAGISTAANLVRNTSPYNLNGLGLTAGVWDQAKVSVTTPEFAGRLRIADASSVFSFHATHCAGTIGAAGARADALGMAPSVKIDSYDWFNDASEMAATASATATDGRLMISSHSYGTRTGWGSISRGVYIYFGLDGDNQEARGFGQYSSRSRSWDEIVHNAPFYLPFKAAGNDRSNRAPQEGANFRYSNATNIFKYSSAVHPLRDGGADGYDSITHIGIAKNIMTVGAANDAVSGGLRDPSRSTIGSFSGFGPADDGRIKPDIVANGVSLLSPSIEGSTAVVAVDNYRSLSGTSMATPNASGSAVLIQEAAQEEGSFLRASALKGLIIHTADDIGRPGPDYVNGWGLMNTKAAIDLIRDDAQFTSNQRLGDIMLVQGATETIRLDHDQAGPIRVTICWTDPAGTGSSSFDNRTPVLVNDIDLRVRRVGGSSSFPYRLNVNSPASNATQADNTVDNTEQVYIANAAAGLYEIVISHKGNLSGGTQTISLIQDGLKAQPGGVGNVPVITSGGSAAGTRGSSFVYQITATQNPTSYSVSGTLPPGLVINSTTGRISGTPTASGTWSVTLRALNQSGTSVGKSLSINIAGLPPVITSSGTASGTQGSAFTYQAAATNNPDSWSITAGNLPPGVSLNGNTGRISGTPTSAGTFSVTLRATNAHGFDEQQLVITIQSAPLVITSAGTAQGTVGSAFTYQATASNNPTVWSISGTLPPGLSWSGATRRITGTPSTDGTWTVTIIAANSSGSGNRRVTITIAPAANIPVITNNINIGNAGTVGTPFFYQITASNKPTTYSWSLAIPGLALNPNTGRISGIPTSSGNWTRTLRATNASGTGTKNITFRFTGGSLALQTVPFSQDFGNGMPHAANGWTYNMDAIEGQITVVDGALRLDSLHNVTNANNEVILNLNVGNGNNGIDFSFRHRNRSDEPRALPTSFTGSVDGDGVSMSVDGNNWVRIFDLAGESTSIWQTETLDLDQMARDNNLNFAGHVRIKVQQYDNFSVGIDGREFDDFQVTSAASTVPVVTSSGSANGTVGQFFNYQITASNSPTSYGWYGGVVPGLTLNPSTGRISGTPTQAGTFTRTNTATNASGSGSKQITITIAPPASQGLVIPYSQDFNGNGLPLGWSTFRNNEGRIQFLNGEMVMDDTTGNSVHSLNTATLKVNLAGKNNVTLSFKHFNSSDENAAMAASFTGRPNVDGVAMSVDSQNWFRVVDFNGAVPGYQTHSANLSQVAAANNLTLNSSTQIRFFQYDNHPEPVDGRKFDEIRVVEGDDRPVITGAGSRTGRMGSAFFYSATATGNPTSWSVSGTLPPGLSLNSSTGLISGTPTAKGTFVFVLRATNASGTGIRSISFRILDIQPVITSPSSAMGTVGIPFSYQATATGNPTVFTLSGTLPAGLTFSSSTGLISGTPTSVGTVDVTLRASNGSTSPSHALTITINQVPTGTPVPQAVPYVEYWNSPDLPSIADGWRFRSQNEGRIQVVDRALQMDDTTANNTYSLNEAELHVDLANLNRVQLSFSSRRFNDENTALPATFTGSVNGDGVSLSVDGVNWIRLIDFSSVATATNLVSHNVNLLSVATAAGITLTSNTRIRFQQYDNHPVGSAGRMFDSIRVRGELPVITSASTVNGQIGSRLSYTIRADVPVTNYSNQTLPPGLTRASGSAVISGIPTQAGTFKVRVYALNGNGWGGKDVTFNITDPAVGNALFGGQTETAADQTLVLAADADGAADFTMPTGYDRVLVTGVKVGAQVFDTTDPVNAIRLRVEHLATIESKGVYFPLAAGRSIEIR